MRFISAISYLSRKSLTFVLVSCLLDMYKTKKQAL
ncbi:hypothetical protein PARMER_02328 [Parabacteroides merdae ATCC 43184]|nr:hypothetical protein PARMER_02328 [Parabacteroides merdae ATCC 43184]